MLFPSSVPSSFRLMSLLLLCMQRIQWINSFSLLAVPQRCRPSSAATKRRNRSHGSNNHRNSALWVVADAEEKEKKGQNRSDDDNYNNESAWTATANGGYLPNLASRNPTIAQVTTIDEYKQVVADEKDLLVCVRFYAPWCRACRAVQTRFRKLARRHPTVKFVECPLTKSNAFLHEGLGVPSLPFSHVYHPSVGLIEERKIGRKVFDDFEQVLQAYVDGYCEIDWSTTGAMGSENGSKHSSEEEELPLQ